MQTLRLIVDPSDPARSEAQISKAAAILTEGGTVAFPTETVYGLGAHALDPAAVEKIFAAKQRPGWDPLIVHVTDEPMLRHVVSDVPDLAREAIARFWPGPLTLLLGRAPDLPGAVTAGRPKVAVRMPAHPIAHALITIAGIPLAAPSANLFGRTSPTTAEHVLADLDGRIDAILDAGPTRVGVESTVADVSENPPVIYRAGAISLEQLQALFPGIGYYQSPAGDTGLPEALPSPGTAIRHYAPRAKLVLAEPDEVLQTIRAFGDRKIGLMLPREVRLPEKDVKRLEVYEWGSLDDAESLAHGLFAGLRSLDGRNVEVIVCPVPRGDRGIFPAIRDRLDKAAR